ncbi:hypothetical protein ABPG75_010830 [Micractinium tetrahymenae]
MGQPRCLLLPALAGLDSGPELLPPGTSPEQALSQGRLFETAVVDGARLIWREDGIVGWQHNPVASSLARLQVCGEAVLALPADPEAAAHLLQRVEALAAKHAAGSPPWRPGSRRHSLDGPATQQGWPQGQQQLVQRLLRRPAREAAPAVVPRARAEAALPAAPGTPRRADAAGPSHSTSISTSSNAPSATSAAGLQQPQPEPPWGQAERQAACQRRLQRQQGQEAAHEVRVFECEPRQALLWSIAGRATSLSWHGDSVPGTAGAAGVAGAARAAVSATGAAVAEQFLAAGAAAGAAGAELSLAAGAVSEGAFPGTEATPQATEPATTTPPPQPAPAGGLQPHLPAPPLPAPARQRSNRSSLDQFPWGDLQPEVLALVLAQAGHGAEAARAVGQVCRGWRQGLAGERGALQRLRFATLRWLGGEDATAGSCSGGSGADGSGGGIGGGAWAVCSSSSGGSGGGVQLPWLVQLAVKAGNVAATVAAARFLETRLRTQLAPHERLRRHLLEGQQGGGGGQAPPGGDAASGHGPAVHAGRAGHAGRHEADLARLWAKAAKLGHPEGQWKVGYAHYKGLMGLPRDGEEALLWLGRAARQLGEAVAEDAGSSPSSGSTSSSGGGEGSVGSSAEAATAAGRALPALLDAASCRRILAQAAHILGYLHLDGEGTKADVGAAIRWFRLAERHGCRDAGRVLGSLFNTGQYA